MQAGIDALCMWGGELFEMTNTEMQLAKDGFVPDRAALLNHFNAAVDKTFAEARLQKPQGTYMQIGGRAGKHTEHLGYMLSEMQVLARRHPQAVW